MTVSNQVILVGRIYRPAQRYYRPDGSAVVQFPLELTDSDGAGPAVPRERPGRHLGSGPANKGRGRATDPVKRNVVHVVAFGELAEIKLDMLQEGQRLRVVGRLNQRQWLTPQGQNRSQIEVIATDLRMPGEDPAPEDERRGEKDEKTC